MVSIWIFAPEDVYVYSIDEAFIDLSPYQSLYGTNYRQLAEQVVTQIYTMTGITATVGVGENLFLAKVAMDIIAKHEQPTQSGLKYAQLNVLEYREQLWKHQPLTDFWQVGPGTMQRLAQINLHTMGDIAVCSQGKNTDFYNEQRLFKILGKKAEILIDHAWGVEPLTLATIRQFRPKNHSIFISQILAKPCAFADTLMIVKEMGEELALKLVDTQQTTARLSFWTIKLNCIKLGITLASIVGMVKIMAIINYHMPLPLPK